MSLISGALQYSDNNRYQLYIAENNCAADEFTTRNVVAFLFTVYNAYGLQGTCRCRHFCDCWWLQQSSTDVCTSSGVTWSAKVGPCCILTTIDTSCRASGPIVGHLLPGTITYWFFNKITRNMLFLARQMTSCSINILQIVYFRYAVCNCKMMHCYISKALPWGRNLAR